MRKKYFLSELLQKGIGNVLWNMYVNVSFGYSVGRISKRGPPIKRCSSI
ncbi:hypothetical protein MY7_1049 [Bacillus sp. 5B6]|nr:hypothetical protein MY7_1049 [Bacillus sp. 5B6]